MTARSTPTSGDRTRGIKRIVGRFKPNGAGVIDNTSTTAPIPGTRFGRGYTVARTGTGQYTITTDSPYAHVAHFDASLWSSTLVGAGLFRVTSVTRNPQNVVLVFQHFAESGGAMAAADIAAAADNLVSFCITFSDANVQRA